MPAITEGSLRFDFPDGWDVSKFDPGPFYRGQYHRIGEARVECGKRITSSKWCAGAAACVVCGNTKVAGTKGIDILALDAADGCWHIEVKDYRATRVTDFGFLADVAALKVRDSLACLAAARVNAADGSDRERASRALRAGRLRVVLHLESPPIRGPLLTAARQRANVQNRLVSLVKAIDPRPRVVSQDDMPNIPWTVTQVDSP